ncbi:MAG TPA: hypothetical protein VMF06_23260, partial [Candidatus Limnocylindria bacterium]|nr:hypothetical protein [Candidatus Limnocylindria bacterium]
MRPAQVNRLGDRHTKEAHPCNIFRILALLRGGTRVACLLWLLTPGPAAKAGSGPVPGPDEPSLRLVAPSTTTENAGLIVDGGKVSIPFALQTDLTVKLQTTSPGRLAVPAVVVIPAGQSNVVFSIETIQNDQSEGTIIASLEATAPGYSLGLAQISIQDDDPSFYTFGGIPNPVTAGVPFTIHVAAFTGNGQPLMTGDFAIDVSVADAAGTNLLTTSRMLAGTGPANVTINKKGVFRLLVDGKGAHSRSQEFLVVAADIVQPNLTVVDALYVPSAGRILAMAQTNSLVSSGALYWVDPQNGFAEYWTAIPGGISPSLGRLAVSADGTHFALLAKGSQLVQLWDLQHDIPLVQTNLRTDVYIADLAFSAGSPGLLAIVTHPLSTGQEAVQFLDENLARVTTLTGYKVLSLTGSTDQAGVFFAYYKTFPNSLLNGMGQINAQVPAAVGIEPLADSFANPNPLPFAWLDQQVYSAAGWRGTHLESDSPAISAKFSALPANYKGVAAIATDPYREEVLIATAGSGGEIVVQRFGADSLEMTREVRLPLHGTNALRRLFLPSPDRLAVVVNHALALVSWPVSPIPGAMADIGISAQSLTVQPIIQSPWTGTMLVTNRGPDAASGIRIEAEFDSRPADIYSDFVGGTITVSNSQLIVTLNELPPGQSRSIPWQITPGTGGWLTNRFSVMANEDDPHLSDNSTILTQYVNPSANTNALSRLRLAVKELVFDPERRVVYALERNPVLTNNTALLTLNLDSLEPIHSRPIPGGASKLRLTGDNRFLYAVIEDGQALYRTDLSGEKADLRVAANQIDSAATAIWDYVPSSVDPTDVTVLLERTASGAVSIGGWHDLRADPEPYVFKATNPRLGAYLTAAGKSDEWYFTKTTYNASEVHRLRRVGARLVELNAYQGSGWQAKYPDRLMPQPFRCVGTNAYTVSGLEIDPETGRTTRTAFEISYANPLIAYAPEADRLIYADFLQLRIVDRQSLATVATYSSTSPGIPDSVAVLDKGRAAVSLTDGTVLLLWSIPGLAPLPRNIDLGVALETSPVTPEVGQPVDVTITVTNQGVSQAYNMDVGMELPPYTRTFDQATHLTPSTYRWTNLSLAAGASTQLSARISFTAAGPKTIAAGAIAVGWETNRLNNYRTLTFPVTHALTNNQIATLGFEVRSALFDPTHDEILAIVGNNHPLVGELAAIDPSTGTVSRHARIGANPIAIACGGTMSRLFALTDAGRSFSILDRQSFAQLESHAVMPVTNLTTSEVASEIYVDPGDDNNVILRQSDGARSIYRLYISGIPTPATLGATTGYGYVTPGRFLARPSPISGIVRYAVDANAFVNEAIRNNVSSSSARLDSGALLFADGTVVDANTFASLGQNAGRGLAAYDPPSGIVYYLAPTLYSITAYDLLSHETIGSKYPLQLDTSKAYDTFVAGRDYLAFRVASPTQTPHSDGLLIFRTPYGHQFPTTDLAIRILADGGVTNGGFAHWNVEVTNRGSTSAPDPLISLTLPAGMRLVQPISELQPSRVQEPLVEFRIGTLEPGGSLRFGITGIAPLGVDRVELLGNIRSAARELSPGDNNTSLVQTTIPSTQIDIPTVLPLPFSTKDMVYEKVSGQLYLTAITPDQKGIVATVTPRLHSLVNTTPLSGIPDKLAASRDGQFLYISLDTAKRFVRLKLPGLETDIVADTPFAANTLPNTTVSLVVPAGRPHSLVLSGFDLATSVSRGVWIYDDGTPRLNFVAGGIDGVRFIHPGESADELLGFDQQFGRPQRLIITSDGIVRETLTNAFVSSSYRDFQTGGRLLLTSPGELRVLGSFDLIKSQSVLPDHEALALSDDGMLGLI